METKTYPKFTKIGNNIDGVDFFANEYTNKTTTDDDLNDWLDEDEPISGVGMGLISNKVVNNSLNSIDMEVESMTYFRDSLNDYTPTSTNKKLMSKYGWSKERLVNYSPDMDTNEFNTKINNIIDQCKINNKNNAYPSGQMNLQINSGRKTRQRSTRRTRERSRRRGGKKTKKRKYKKGKLSRKKIKKLKRKQSRKK